MIEQIEIKNLFDYFDGNLIWKTSSARRVKVGDIAGGTNGKKQPYKRIRVNGKRYLAHRLIFLWHHGYMPEIIDHINGNVEDNRIENLRSATKSQNGINSKKPSNNTSGNKNVYWYSAGKKWEVRLTSQKKVFYFGRFEDYELAELVALEARDKYHGKFANNF